MKTKTSLFLVFFSFFLLSGVISAQEPGKEHYMPGNTGYMAGKEHYQPTVSPPVSGSQNFKAEKKTIEDEEKATSAAVEEGIVLPGGVKASVSESEREFEPGGWTQRSSGRVWEIPRFREERASRSGLGKRTPVEVKDGAGETISKGVIDEEGKFRPEREHK